MFQRDVIWPFFFLSFISWLIYHFPEPQGTAVAAECSNLTVFLLNHSRLPPAPHGAPRERAARQGCLRGPRASRAVNAPGGAPAHTALRISREAGSRPRAVTSHSAPPRSFRRIMIKDTRRGLHHFDRVRAHSPAAPTAPAGSRSRPHPRLQDVPSSLTGALRPLTARPAPSPHLCGPGSSRASRAWSRAVPALCDRLASLGTLPSRPVHARPGVGMSFLSGAE